MRERDTHTVVSAFVLQFQRCEWLIGATRTIKRSERQLKVVWRVLIKKVGRDGNESGVELTQEALARIRFLSTRHTKIKSSSPSHLQTFQISCHAF